MITPLEIKNLEFNQTFRGYDKQEVDSALKVIADSLEKKNSESSLLQQQIKSLEQRVGDFKNLEKSLTDSAMMMQVMLEDKRKEADKEASLILQEAKQKASGYVVDYEERIKVLKQELEYLKNQRTDYLIKFKHFINTQKDWLDAVEDSTKNS